MTVGASVAEGTDNEWNLGGTAPWPFPTSKARNGMYTHNPIVLRVA